MPQIQRRTRNYALLSLFVASVLLNLFLSITTWNLSTKVAPYQSFNIAEDQGQRQLMHINQENLPNQTQRSQKNGMNLNPVERSKVNVQNEPIKLSVINKRPIRVNQGSSQVNKPKTCAASRYELETAISNPVSCSLIFANDTKEIKKAVAHRRGEVDLSSDEALLQLAKDCTCYRQSRFLNIPVSQKEKEFPIAISIFLYKNAPEAERLLRLIYRPHNLYLIHVDLDANPMVYNAIQAVSRCYDNVFMVSRRTDIIYAHFSRLQAEIITMREALEYKHIKWKYYINLPSQEMPLNTNSEMVDILMQLKGANDISTSVALRNRYKYSYFTRYANDRHIVARGTKLKDPPPHGLKIVKCVAYGSFSRGFVEFFLTDKIAQDLLVWSKDTYSPDEHYWGTLNDLKLNPHLKTPGGRLSGRTYRSTYVAWNGVPCYSGHKVHGICIFGVEDLPTMIDVGKMFANKFSIDFDPIAVYCMEEWYKNKASLPNRY